MQFAHAGSVLKLVRQHTAPAIGPKGRFEDAMNLTHSLILSLVLAGCGEQTSQTRNETDIRALTVEIAALRTELEQVRTRAIQNSAEITDWEDDVQALWTIVGENQNRLSENLVTEESVEASIASGAGPLGTLAGRIEALESAVADNTLAMASTSALAEKVAVNAAGDVVFSDTNVFIQNGTAATDTLNGKGNLIVGYATPEGDPERGGSHNVIVGDGHSYAGHSGLAIGHSHRLTADHAVAVGGYGNQVGGDYGVTVGGQYNVTNGMYGTVTGGGFGLASGAYSSVFGGSENTATAPFSAVTGGRLNVVSGDYASIAGGEMTTVVTDALTVAGGVILVEEGAASAAMLAELDASVTAVVETLDALEDAVIDGDREATDRMDLLEAHDTIQDESIALNRTAFEGVTLAVATLSGSLEETSATITGIGSTLETHETHLEDLEARVTLSDQLMTLVSIDERGDVVFEDTNLIIRNGSGLTTEATGSGNLILGYNDGVTADRSGSHNIVMGDNHVYSGTSTLIVGEAHRAAGHGSAILGGEANLLTGTHAAIVGGVSNEVSGLMAANFGGSNNTVSGNYAIAIGGFENTATGSHSAAGPGRSNAAEGDHSAAMGGGLNLATGDTSAVFGGYALEAEEAFDSGAVTTLTALVESEQTRLDDTIESLEYVASITDDHEGRLDASDAAEADLAGAVTLLESADESALVQIGEVQTELDALTDTVSADRSDRIAADDAFNASLETTSDAIDDLGVTVESVSYSTEVIDGRLDSVESTLDENGLAIAELDAAVTTNSTEIAGLQEYDGATAPFFDLVTVEDDTIFITSANLHLRNGSGDTDTPNGSGNLIIGYNGSETFAEDRTGSHNIVVGDQHAYTSTGGIVSGTGSQLTEANAAIIGGSDHIASAAGAAIVGGLGHEVSSTAAVLIGGQFGTASGGWSTVIGGSSNTASGPNSTVVGGYANHSTAESAVAVAGRSNTAGAAHTLTLGGEGRSSTDADGVAPIDSMNAAIASLEAFTATLDADVAEDIASNTSRIADLEGQATSLDAELTSQADTLASHTVSIAGLRVEDDTLSGQIDSLEEEDLALWDGIDDLDSSRDVADNFLSYVTVSATGDIVFEDTNVVIRNGTGTTDGEPNGTGNLVIGYNEIDEDSSRSGSHNLILGMAHSYESFGGIISGENNVQLGELSSILGGSGNTTTGTESVIVAGQSNVSSGKSAAVIAGHSNNSEGMASAVVAGLSNIASGLYSTIVAGNANDTTGAYSVVVAGGSNEATAESAVVVGGQMNQATGNASVVLSGKSNTAGASTSGIVAGWLNQTGAQHAAVLGGYDNTSSGDYATVGGGFKNEASHSGAWVAGSYTDSTGLYTVDF